MREVPEAPHAWWAKPFFPSPGAADPNRLDGTRRQRPLRKTAAGTDR
jgi:hypothetical protein